MHIGGRCSRDWTWHLRGFCADIKIAWALCHCPPFLCTGVSLHHPSALTGGIYLATKAFVRIPRGAVQWRAAPAHPHAALIHADARRRAAAVCGLVHVSATVKQHLHGTLVVLLRADVRWRPLSRRVSGRRPLSRRVCGRRPLLRRVSGRRPLSRRVQRPKAAVAKGQRTKAACCEGCGRRLPVAMGVTAPPLHLNFGTEIMYSPSVNSVDTAKQ